MLPIRVAYPYFEPRVKDLHFYKLILLVMAFTKGLEPLLRHNRTKSLANSPLHQLE